MLYLHWKLIRAVCCVFSTGKVGIESYKCLLKRIISRAFLMRSVLRYIDETVGNEHTVIRLFILFVFFSVDKNGSFYGSYEAPQRSSFRKSYFSNDPVNHDNPPSYLIQH